MTPALAPVFMFLGMLLSQGRNMVDFTNDVLNNVVSITGDAHQARVAQDIFRQEVRYERSLQIREDIRDQRKVMLESVTSYLYFGSIILATCFVTVIEGFPPINSSRMVVDWWLLFASWAITFELLAMWYALCFQVKLSQSARERLLRRYRYRLVDDQVVDRMGGKNLVNTMFDLNKMMANSLTQMLQHAEPDVHVAPEKVDLTQLRMRVRSLDQQTVLHCAPLRKQMNAWMHQDGIGYAMPTILDAPYFLMGETLLRQTWHLTGEKPLLLRVKGEATLYVAAQCPPLGGSGKSTATMHGLYKAVGADVPEWPEDELPVITSGFHPAWQGPSGYGELQRVDGASILIDENHIEIPVYKIVLDKPTDGYVDVIICWQFQAYCEAPMVILRKGHVHCKEEDWPMAEFNEEIRQIMPLQDYSGWYMRRGTVCLMVNVCFAVLSRLWIIGERSMWWTENVLMMIVLLPAMVIMYGMPISISSTVQALRMSVINRVDSISEKGIDAAAKWMEKQLSQGSLNTRQNIMADADPFRRENSEEATTSPGLAYTLYKTAPAGLFASSQDALDTTGSKDGSYFDEHKEHDCNSPRRVPSLSDAALATHTHTSPTLTEKSQVTEPRPATRGILQGCCEAPQRPPPRTIINSGVGIPSQSTSEVPPLEAPQASAVPMCGRLCGGPVEVARPHRVLVTCPPEVTARKSNSRNAESTQPSFSKLDLISDSSSLKLGAVVLPVRTSHIRTTISHVRACCSYGYRCIPPCLRCIPRGLANCCRRCSCHIGGLPRGQSQQLYGDTANYRMLSKITTFLDLLFLFSALFVLGGPSMDWFRVALKLGPQDHPNAEEGRRRLDPIEPVWTLWPVTWPPFLDLTAAALESQGDTLYAASGSILYMLARTEGSPTFSTIGQPYVFPEAVRGLCFSGTSLFAVSDRALYEVSDSFRNQSSRDGKSFSSLQQNGLLGLAYTASHRGREIAPSLTHGLSPISTATAVEVPGEPPLRGARSTAILLATREGEVQFTAGLQGKLKPLARVAHSGRVLWNVTGLHASAATARISEPVLWAAGGSGDIEELGLSTGRLLGRLPRPRVPDVLRWQRLRGRTSIHTGDDVLRILALTGNATHLVAIGKVEGQQPVVLSTLYESVVAGDSGLEL